LALNPDPWLDRWLPLLSERSAGTPLLELGCGGGADTETLVAAGHDVIALDLSAGAVAAAKRRVPTARFLCQDLREPFPVGPGSMHAIVASLSLHYFPWPETEALMVRIRDTLQPGGLLLCRLNSTNDHHFGASGHPRIEDNYFLVDGAPKRFFDRASVLKLFAQGWNTRSLDEQVTGKYGQPKALWEVILEKSA
jgi:SAM-dependent methyltransferase